MKTPKWFLKKGLIARALVPVSLFYYCASRIVFRMRARHPLQSRRPIICVGNILAGGVGKTPIVRQIAEFFDAPVVMRGYKKTNATNNIGDEALMLSRYDLSVHTGDRKSNIILLNKQKSNAPIVMDDGFQNPSIKKDVSVIVVDEEFGFGNGFLLPAGPKRETLNALYRADAIIIIKSGGDKKKFNLPAGIPVFYAENTTIPPYGSDVPLVAFAGIGYPEKFFRRLDNVVKKVPFPDHYQYTDMDIKKLRDLAEKHNAKLVTTEKDWVRLSREAQQDIKFAALDTKIENKFFVWLKEKLNGDF
ncbi:MAG: tetraacyldisaccharide 4'-kinase [Proteobacteria bacterium]|nr:tetraacyldisaccharide 4'-kinase [Candidatus Enterousia onthequi]